MQRISVVGSSGSGKSTVARELARGLGVPYLELDAVRHQPRWQELPDDEFIERVAAFAAQDHWVIDGNYAVVRESVVWPRADTVVWLDLPRRTVMRQVIWRTVRRAVLREELWNGNRESTRNLVAWDPHKSIIRWAWTHYPVVQARYSAASTEPRWAAVAFVRIRSRREATAFLSGVAGGP